VIPCDKSDWVAAYALGCLEPDERQQFELHLPTCQSCQSDLRAYQSVMTELALAAPRVEPPARLRAAILQKASPPLSKPVQPATRLSVFSWLGRLFMAHPVAWGIASLVLIVALVFSNIFFIAQDNQGQLAQAATFHTVILYDTNPQGDSKALLVISDDGRFGTLVTDNLPALNSQSQYQLWLVKDNTRTSGGLFKVTDTGYGWLKIEATASLLTYQSFGVTVEPAGGSVAPTGLKVLGGNQ
jgi:anti-sigma-K factor RskA